MSLVIRQFLSEKIFEFDVFNFRGSFCCHFEIVVLKKDYDVQRRRK